MDYEVERCTRRCAATGRELQPGELYYSTLSVERRSIVRSDFSFEGWQGPPPGVLAWWKSHLPKAEAAKRTWAPNDVMLELFEGLETQPDQQDFRYVLALLLVRRRVMRVEETRADEQGRETLVAYCPRREREFQVLAVLPDPQRAEEIQTELSRLFLEPA